MGLVIEERVEYKSVKPDKLIKVGRPDERGKRISDAMKGPPALGSPIHEERGDTGVCKVHKIFRVGRSNVIK